MTSSDLNVRIHGGMRKFWTGPRALVAPSLEEIAIISAKIKCRLP